MVELVILFYEFVVFFVYVGCFIFVFIWLIFVSEMSASVARSEKILNRLVAETGLSDPAVEWLKTTLDPFHDNPLNCTGIPDSTCGNSVVQCIKSSTEVSCPWYY